MILNDVHRGINKNRKRKRIGRGPGSGHGKTSGRGHKGQGQRSGCVAINGFEGGQMPIYMRAPKRGFTKPNAKTFSWVNTGRIEKAIEAGRLDPKETVDAAAMVKAGLIRRPKDGVRLLAKGALKSKIELVVTGASKAAIEAVEKAGGKVTVTAPVAEPENA